MDKGRVKWAKKDEIESLTGRFEFVCWLPKGGFTLDFIKKLGSMYYVWVCTECGDFRDYGSDISISKNPSAFIKCETCEKNTVHRQCDEEGNFTHGQEVPLAEAQLEEQESQAEVSPGVDAGMAGGGAKPGRGKD